MAMIVLRREDGRFAPIYREVARAFKGWKLLRISAEGLNGDLPALIAPVCLLIEALDVPDESVALCRRVRMLTADSGVPVVLVAEQAVQRPLRSLLCKTGCADVLLFPDDANALIAGVGILARARTAEDRLRAVNQRLSGVLQERILALRESNERCRFLTGAVSDAVLVFELEGNGEDGRLVEMNEAAQKLAGYTREEWAHMSLRRLIDPDRVGMMPVRLESIRAHRELFFETVVRSKDGRKTPMEVIARVLDPDAERKTMIAVARQIEPPAPQAVIASDVRDYRYLAFQTGQMIYDCNLRTNEVVWGGAVAQITGHSHRQMTQYGWRGWLDKILLEDRPRVTARLSEAQHALGRYQVEYRITHTSGEIRYLEDCGVVLPDSDGAAYRLLGNLKDITARVQAEEQRRRLEHELQHSQRLESLGVLAGGIAHDFNNILAGIIGLTDLALREIPEGHNARTDLSEALQAAHRAKELVMQILAFSRQSGRERAPIFLHIVAREAIRLLRASLPANIEIIDSVDVHSGTVLANAAQMYQVIMNFCTNAAHAMRAAGGKLEIIVRDVDASDPTTAHLANLRPGPYVHLSVLDTGHGMAPAVLARAFDPFFTTKGPGEGTGMGLAVVHGIVADHQGAVSAESRLGRGSDFHVYLPRIAGVVAEGEQQGAHIPGGHEHILFVDDDDAVLRFAEAALPRLGFQVTLCRDAESGLKAFDQNRGRFHLVITDQVMPGMSGEEFASAIHVRDPRIPILLFTGFSEEFSRKRIEGSGIRDIAFKPIIVKDLVERIRRLLDAP